MIGPFGLEWIEPLRDDRVAAPVERTWTEVSRAAAVRTRERIAGTEYVFVDSAADSSGAQPADHPWARTIGRFIETRQPLLTLHGHVHESARLTGAWMDQIGPTVLLGAAHDGPELALIRFDLERPDLATRELV